MNRPGAGPHRLNRPGAGLRRAVPAALPAALLTAGALLLAGCGTGTTSAATATSGSATSGSANGAGRPAPANGTVTDRALPASLLGLALTDPTGRSVTLGSLRGKAIVLTDFLTTCQEICPMTSVNVRTVADAATRAGLGDSVQLLEITVDPERDDASRLAAYQKQYGAIRPNWTLLTGTPSTIATLWKVLGVQYSRTPSDTPPPTDWLTGKPLTYDVSHQDVVFLIDATGHERWLVEGTPDTGGAAPPPTLQHFLSDEGRANLKNPEATGQTWTARDVESAITWLSGRPLSQVP
jgi:cytochrome oxidase Cu insertion factor (SCO1/SenC/PrrC family)